MRGTNPVICMPQIDIDEGRWRKLAGEVTSLLTTLVIHDIGMIG